MSAVMPNTLPVERTRTFQDEWAVRYGVLMGGTRVTNLDGIGQFWVGHSEIPRRQLVGFTHQQVRGRSEAEDSAALDEPGGGLLLGASPLESKKLMDKSPALCMREMIQMFGAKGFINSQTLMGDTSTADQIFNAVLPPNIAALPLVDVIAFLEDGGRDESENYIAISSFLKDELKPRAQLLRGECLAGGYIAREYMTNYTNAISDEIGGDKKTGKKKVDSVDIQYFWELKLTLPKDKPLEATTNLGKEIAAAFAGKGGDTSALIEQMARQNQLQAEANELRRQELAQSAPTETKRGPGRPRSPETNRGE